MGATGSSCMRRGGGGGDVSQPINGVDDIALDRQVRASLPPDDDPMSREKADEVAAPADTAAAAAVASATAGEETGKRRHYSRLVLGWVTVSPSRYVASQPGQLTRACLRGRSIEYRVAVGVRASGVTTPGAEVTVRRPG